MTTGRAGFLRRGHGSIRNLIPLVVYQLFPDHGLIVIRIPLDRKKYRIREPWVSTAMTGNIWWFGVFPLSQDR